jgi:hypothetical protein
LTDKRWRVAPTRQGRRQGYCGAIPFAEVFIMLSTILLVVLILLLIGVVPAWPHSRGWGYGPSGGIGLLVLILVVLLLMGRI